MSSDRSRADVASWQPDGEAIDTRSLVDVLLRDQSVTRALVDEAQRLVERTPGHCLSRALIQLGADQEHVQHAAARTARMHFERVTWDDVDDVAIERLGLLFCEERSLLPLGTRGERFVVGTTAAHEAHLLDEVRGKLGISSIKHVLVTPDDVSAVIERFRAQNTTDEDVEAILADVDEDDVEVVDAQEAQDDADADASPVVRYVNLIIQTAVREGASDIHLEPTEHDLRVRFRVDGILQESMRPPRRMQAAITSRLKIMASLDIAERRLPQDGRIRAHVLGRTLDLRVSTCPTPHGEKTVLRILDSRSIRVPLDELGFDERTLVDWRTMIAKPHGIVLVTGPTGSGKTTTLYASLQELDISRLNISTVEDPVEYQLAGITQVQTHERIGLTFASALRTLLRQDPDVVMVGEIRDQETATIATQAALTGHLVLSTLHTNDAPSAITRLVNIGIEPYLVSGAVNGVLAQRLVRRTCRHCAQDQPVPEAAAQMLKAQRLDQQSIVHGEGCERCRMSGYAGRMGIHELLQFDDALRDVIASNPAVGEFRAQCVANGMRTLRQDAIDKMVKGMTTLEEVLRVTDE
ncbi:MAG: GspE/PulE family protein [Phycisphaerales bacterium]|nr:GspE/PulE family protein [Phycisphaerales bacterium]